MPGLLCPHKRDAQTACCARTASPVSLRAAVSEPEARGQLLQQDAEALGVRTRAPCLCPSSCTLATSLGCLGLLGAVASVLSQSHSPDLVVMSAGGSSARVGRGSGKRSSALGFGVRWRALPWS